LLRKNILDLEELLDITDLCNLHIFPIGKMSQAKRIRWPEPPIEAEARSEHRRSLETWGPWFQVFVEENLDIFRTQRVQCWAADVGLIFLHTPPTSTKAKPPLQQISKSQLHLSTFCALLGLEGLILGYHLLCGRQIFTK
jgi:hypothetical protein